MPVLPHGSRENSSVIIPIKKAGDHVITFLKRRKLLVLL